MNARAWLGATLSLWLLLLCASARAQGFPVLFEATEETAFSNRVRAEISAMGFELVSADALDDAGRSTVKAAAQVIETPPPRRIELWLRNEKTGQLELATVITAPATNDERDDAPETVRASEQLRAFFQPLRANQSEPEPPASVEPETAKPVSEPEAPKPTQPQPDAREHDVASTKAHEPTTERTRYVEEVALALPLDRGTLGLDAVARAGAWVSGNLGVGAKVVIPILDAQAKQGANSANLSTTWFGAELWYLAWSAPEASVAAHAGLALAWLRAQGEASAPAYTAQSVHAFAALPSLGFRARRHVIGNWSVSLSGELGTALPKFDVVFAGQRVGTWSEPVGLVSLGASLDL